MPQLYPDTTIGDRTGTLAYFDDEMSMCDPSRAAWAKLVCDNGDSLFFSVSPRRTNAGENMTQSLHRALVKERSAKSLSYRERIAMLLSFDPDQPRDENGRWVAFHGTSAASVDDIKSNGLLVSKNYDRRGRPPSVYVTTSERRALYYAEWKGSERTRDGFFGGTMAVVEVAVPADVWSANAVEDEQDDEEAFRFERDIPPEWIKAVDVLDIRTGAIKRREVQQDGQWKKTIGLRSDASVTVFVPVMLESVSLRFDPDQPRDENGRWSSEGGGSNVYRFIGEPDKKVEREIFGKVGVVKDVAAGMVADVDSVDFSASVRDTMYGTIEVDLKGEDGSIITRSFSKEDGKLVVDHDEFRRAPETPNFGKDAMRSMMREYERIGVDEVRTITDDTGGYAWARYGFLPDDPSVVAEKISSRLDSRALSYLSASDKAAIRRHIDPSDPKTLWRVADMRIGDRKVGYDILNGMEWHGRLKLSDKAQMKRFKQYVGDKKR